MYFGERISLEGPVRTYPLPLPRPAADLIELFRGHGLEFRELSDWTLAMDAEYDPQRLAAVQRIVDSEGLDLVVHRSVRAVYDEQDYANAPLWVVTFPDVWIKGIDFRSVCSECGKTHINVDTSVTVLRVKTDKAVAAVNGQAKIVRDDVRAMIWKQLTGVKFSPFDEAGDYFYLQADASLGPLIHRPDEMINYRGPCSVCGWPKFDMFFGVYRYSKEHWSGQDVVFAEFCDAAVYTPRAFELLHSFQRGASRWGIVVLE